MTTIITKVGTDIYPGYKKLTFADADAMERANKLMGWGLTYSELMGMIDAHKVARETGDVLNMEKIEYRLTDANFHREARLLKEAEYDAMQEIAFKEYLA